MRGISLILLAFCGCLACSGDAEETAKTDDVSLTFTEKSPLSDPIKITKRTGWSLETIKKQVDPNYELSAESFSAYVPEDYDGSKPFGLFVWINAGPKGDIPSAWKPVFDKHHLILIGANNGGNPRPILIRMGMALDAVKNMKGKYKIDDARIYVGGASGGGKVATILGVAWPDAFRGGFYMIGTCHYREVATGEPGHYWPKGFDAPESKLLMQSKQQNRHVFMTGEKDMNRKPTQGMSAAYKSDRFLHVTVLDVPGAGHEIPDAEWFEKGIIALDVIPVSATKPVKPKL